MNKLINRFLYKISHNFFSYIAHIIFISYIALQWFIGQRFWTQAGTTDLHRFFAAFPFAYIFYIPFIVSSGRIKNQQHLPFSSLKISLAFIVSSFIVCLINIILTMTVPLCINIFGNVEWSQFLCGYTGIFLFTFCAVSLTVFIFTLINNTAAAFVFSAICLAVCNSIHNIPLYLNTGNFISSIVKIISFAWNFDSFAKGILNLKEILYFILASSLFLFLTYFVLEKRMGNCSVFYKKTVQLFTVTFVLLCICTNFINLKADLTASKKFSISSCSQNIIKKITEPVSITYYLSSNLKNLYPQVKDVSDYLEIYSSQSSEISFKIVNPSSADLQNKLKDYGINGQPVQTNSISSSTVTNVYSAVILDFLGMTETIPFVLNASTLEFDLAQKLTSLIEEKKRLVQLVIANNLSIENDYSYLFPYLKSLGYVPFLSELPSAASDKNKAFNAFKNIPLIVMGSENFTKEDCNALEKFLLDGGKAFIAAQPYSVNIKDDWSIKQTQEQLYFSRMLFTFGIYFKPTLTCDISNFRLTMVSDSSQNGTALDSQTEYINYSLWPVLRPQNFAPDGMTTFWPCAFDIDEEVADIENFTVSSILQTSSASWQMDKIDGKFITSPFVLPAAAEENEAKGPFNIAAKVLAKENPEDIRLILFGDQYSFSTPMLSYSSGETMDFRSLEFLGNALLLIDGQKDLLSLKNKGIFNYSLYKIPQEEYGTAVRRTFMLSIVLPFILIISAGVLMALRRRKIIFSLSKKEKI